ncbi:sugar kinase [Chloroflexi bacterium TSY]|nr:sugar kinase [Chloroflexi bacterium TSY]
MQYDLTTVGETMLRYSVPAGQRLETMRTLDVYPAGAEGNVAVALSQVGRRTAWIGGLPNNPLGHYVANQVRMAGVNLDGVVWSNTGRMGIAYVEFAAPPRAIQVIYDRTDSVASQLGPDQIDWGYLLNTRLLHLTGITPALSDNCYALTKEAITRAKAANISVSFDINYRNKLWSEEEAGQTLLPLIQEVDLLFCGQADAEKLFGCQGTPEAVVEQLVRQSNAKIVCVTFGDQGVVVWDGLQFLRAPAYPVEVIDRIGAGDALAAGIIHGWLDGDLDRGARNGVALAAMVLTQHGDMLTTNQAELDALLENTVSGVNR